MNSGSQSELCTLFEQFYQEHRHPYVPPYPEFNLLFTLISRARTSPDRLSKAESNCLNRRGFDWTASKRLSRWMHNYYALKSFYEAQGHSDLPDHYPPNQRLGSWAYRQRSRKDKLSSRQVTMLNDLRFTWIDSSSSYQSPSFRQRWENMYERLEQFQAEHGHVLVPSTYSDNKLARWVERQRNTSDRLNGDQIERLEALGFVFDMKLQKNLIWEFRYQQLKEFYREKGHSRVPQNHPNSRLANWVRSQKSNRDNLSEDRLEKLKEVGFEFLSDLKSSRDQQWLNNFRQAEAFYKKHGHLSITQDKKLYRWLYKQKARRPKEEYRRVLLRQLGISHPEDT